MHVVVSVSLSMSVSVPVSFWPVAGGPASVYCIRVLSTAYAADVPFPVFVSMCCNLYPLTVDGLSVFCICQCVMCLPVFVSIITVTGAGTITGPGTITGSHCSEATKF